MIAFFAPALAFLKRVPWPVYAALALLALWAWDRTAQYNQGWREGRAELEADYRKALDEATRAAEAAKASEEAALKALAEETDNEIEQELRSELDRARDFIRRNRVQPCAGSAARRPAPPAEDRSARDDGRTRQAPELDDPATGVDILPDADEGLVVVPAQDVLICTRNTILAEEWRKWGLALEKRGE